MIEKISSHELNKIYSDTQSTLKQVNDQILSIKGDMSKKLEIIKYEIDFINHCVYELNTSTQKENVVTLFDNRAGYYDAYETDVYAKLIKEPVNNFNIRMSGLNTFYFRDDIVASIDGVKADKYTNIFKHDTAKTEVLFEKYSTDNIVLTVELNDLTNILYPTRFNMIEIDSFLKGSYTIKELRIYELNEELEKTSNYISLTNFNKIGKNRIILDKKYHFYKIEFVIKLLYKVNENNVISYPFGLKHIYLYDADYDANSFVIVPIHCDENIAIVKDTVVINSNRGVRQSTVPKEKIELYMQYENNVLSLPIECSTPNYRRELSLNTKVVYAKVPLAPNTSTSCIQFFLEKRIE